ncbi:S1C family serine protease [Patescibacteria group bacterium]
MNDKKNNGKIFTQNILITAIIASLVIGGISGGIFGVLATTNPTISSWVQQNVLGQDSLLTPGESIIGKGTIQIEEDSATVDVVQQVQPAVVSIVVKQDLSLLSNNTSPFGNFFSFPTAPEGLQEVGAGTGFIISSDGLIVTNKHVVSNSQTSDSTEYTVILHDGTQYDATVLDTDPFNDLALVKVEATGLTKLELGDSESLQIGQTVIAIGNALGEFSNSVTRGVVSGLSRTITAGTSGGSSETLEDIIQTDAAINFGNSGGPLLNLAGQVIGVNTAISQEGQLIGFAIPINQAKKVIESVEKYGKIVRPYLGVRYILLNEAIAEENNLAVNYGALIVKGDTISELAIIPGSPADKAGLEENDIILEIDGKQISRDNSLARMIQKYSPGDTVSLKVLHDGEEIELTAVLAEYEEAE